MAISAADWALATDPFLMASDFSYSSVVGGFPSMTIIGAVGPLTKIIDKNIQEVFWEKDADSTHRFNVDWVGGARTSGAFPNDESLMRLVDTQQL